MTRPAWPSRISHSSSSISSLAQFRPTTAGTFMLRARMAVCEVVPPRSMAKPSAFFSDSMSLGAMSAAT